MPFYEFICKKCNSEYEDLCKYDPTEKYKDVECPKCKSKKKEKIVSAAIVTFSNPVGTSKFESFEYRAGYNMEKAKSERRAAEKATQDTIPAYVPLDDIKSGKNFGKVK
jgi:putative FmdB family regulatory protein